jgi:hypothetical protein
MINHALASIPIIGRKSQAPSSSFPVRRIPAACIVELASAPHLDVLIFANFASLYCLSITSPAGSLIIWLPSLPCRAMPPQSFRTRISKESVSTRHAVADLQSRQIFFQHLQAFSHSSSTALLKRFPLEFRWLSNCPTAEQHIEEIK